MSARLDAALDHEIALVEAMNAPYNALAEAVFEGSAETLELVLGKMQHWGMKMVAARRERERLEREG